MMKKMDNTRSHSWWWDSHICPKNSKWLQENLIEMDSKVSAMLRIIEEDADSFAQRAEMYYKKRPELINLVEEFYRTYRALVERYTYLAREVRQNIAPALQAQLAVSSESAQNSPVDLHLKRGIDGPDIISPSYSYTGASEFDYDSPTEVSTKGQTDDEFSPLGFQTNYERRAFGFKPRFPNLEESSHGMSDSGGLHGTADVDATHLQKELLHLQEKNKDLALKSTEDVTKLENLQVELSSLQSRLRSLEAEEKLTKKRVKSIQEKEQKLEAENLKLSHALISSKEEKTELLEQTKKLTEDSWVADRRIELLEDERVGLKAEVLAAQSQQLESIKNLKRSEEAVQKLQLALTTSEEERLKDSFLIEIFEQQSQDLLKKISDIERQNAGLTDHVSAQAVEFQNLQKQLTDSVKDTRLLEQALDATSQKKICTEQEKTLALSHLKELEKVVEELQREREEQAREIARLKDAILKIQEEGLRVQSEKVEGAKYVCELETSIEDGQQLIKTLRASCQQYEDRCKGLEVKYDELNEKLLSSSEEVSRLQHQVQTLEDKATSSQKQSEVLQKKVSSLVVEKLSLMDVLEQQLKKVIITEGQYTELLKVSQDQKEEIKGLHKELVEHLDKVRRLEEELHLVSEEKIALVEKETEAFMAQQQLKDEHIHLRQQLELNITFTEVLNNRLHRLELEKAELEQKNNHMQQNVLDLQALNSVLSGHCLENKKALQAAEEVVRKVQKDLDFSVSNVEKLQEDSRAKDELLSKMKSEVETLETQVVRYKEENSLLGTDVDKCNGNIAALKAKNNVLNSRLFDLETLNIAVTERVSERDKSIQHLTHELTAAQRQVVALKESCELKIGQTLDLQKKISSFEKQLTLLQAKILESSCMKQSLEAVVEGLQKENFETKEANQALLHEQQGLLNDVAALKTINQDLEANLSHFAREKASLQEENRTYSARCINLEQTIRSLETDYEAAQKEDATLRARLAESEEENSRKLFEAEGRVQDLQLKLSNMLAEEASLAEQLAERIGSNHTLEIALFDVQKDNAALNEELGSLQQQVSSFKIREASLLTEMHSSSDLIQALSAEIEKLKKGVLDAEETGNRFSLDLKAALEECLLLQEKIENLQQDLEISREERAIFVKDITSHSGRSSELECEVKRLEAEKDCLQQELFRAQQVEHRLQEDLEKLAEERQKLSCTLDLQRKKMEKQEEELQNLQCELSFTKDEQQAVADKMNLLTQENSALLQKVMESEQESKQAEENCLRLQTKLLELQVVTAAIDVEISNKVEEVRLLRENTVVLQSAKSELEQKLELWSRKTLEKDNKEKILVERLAEAQEENSKLELHIVDVQRRNKEWERHTEGLDALKQELAAVCIAKKELEQELVELQEDKTTCYHKLEKLQKEFRCLQDQKKKLDSELETAILQGHENMSKLSSLQEQLLSAENLKLELNEKYIKLTEERGAVERKLQEEIVQLRRAGVQEKNELEFQHKRVLELEDEISHFQVEKEALLSDNASIENQMMDLQQHLVELKSKLSEKQEDYLKVSAQAELLREGVSAKENINLELQKQVQTYREENNELVLKIQSTDGEVVQLKDNLHESLYESQRENKWKEINCQVEGEEHVSLKVQNEELIGALSQAKAENTKLETKLAQENAALDIVKHELLVLKEEKGDASNGRPAKMRELVSHMQVESGRLNVEVELYKKEIYYLKKILEGQEFLDVGDVTHTDVRVVQVMLCNLQKSLVMLEEEVRGLKEEVKMELGQKRRLQLLVTDLQLNGLPYTLLLKNKILMFCRGMKLLAIEWEKKAFKESNQIVECIEKLSRAEILCSSLDIQDIENKSCVEEGTHLASEPTGASTLLLQQLQKRVEEFNFVCEAVEAMLLSTCGQDQCKEQEQGLGSTCKESIDSLPMDKNYVLLINQEQELSTKHVESMMEIDMEPDLIVDNKSEGLMHEDTEIVDEVGLDQKKEIDLFEDLAQLHINLGMRLHQALMDEKLELELQELKEEREKLKDDLQARVEQVRSMEAELEKVQMILKRGREGDEIVDPRQHQQWLQNKKRAEKRARKLSKELVLQRETVRNMQDTVVAWTEQQELATEIFEKQVLSLVSKECSPTMEGWDANQVTHLMQEMQSRKALTRRHSMDLQSVGQELQRVGSSIQSTQQQLLKEEEQEQKENQDRVGIETMSVNAAADVTKDHHKLSRFGLAWLILLISTGRRGLLKERPKDEITATTSTKHVQRHHMSTSTILSSLVAQTRKIRCCACAPSSDQLKSLEGK
ncbi:hypothetical protein GOP47_0026885 [Adiantum capillus-veneris]|nr:hypothetical protein GOP47_0026885 [Adiantum capillus-veneris]